MSEIINEFNIFHDFPRNLKQNIKLFHILKHDSTLFGYCVLNDNKVYGIGKTIHQIFGYERSEEKYVLINELSDKNIIDFYGGDNFIYARNINNEIFSWGWISGGKLGAIRLKGYFEDYLKPERISYFNGKNIINISCGFNNCLALSSDGKVYGWKGSRFDDDLLRGKEELIDIPFEIDFKEKIKFIHCKESMSFAVSFEGNPYYWANIGNYGNYTPILIALKNVLKIYYSRDVCIILDKSGKIFEFNPKNEKIFEIKSEVKFCELYYMQDNRRDDCVLQSEDYFYVMKHMELITIDRFNCFEGYSQLMLYNKTIEITKEDFLKTNNNWFNNNFNNEKQNLVLKNDVFYKKFIEKETILNNRFKKENPILKSQTITKKQIIINKNNKYEDKFLQIREIGCGVFGKVFEVKQISDDLIFAIKRVEIENELDLREIEIMSELKSDLIVQYFDSWIEKKLIDKTFIEYLYIQMEICKQNLRTFLELMNVSNDDRYGSFNYFTSCKLFGELIECVNYLHSLPKPIIHRDLKPENILISEYSKNGRFIKLCDFGLAKVHEKSLHTRKVGTFEYMAPEVLNSTEYNTKSDIYSLALIATEIFKFEDEVKVIRQHTNRKDFNKYLQKYLNTSLEKNFRKLLETLLNCLLPEEDYLIIRVSKDYHSRPDCKKLLEGINDFSIDKSIVLKDKNINNFISFLENQNPILKKFFETQISIQ